MPRTPLIPISFAPRSPVRLERTIRRLGLQPWLEPGGRLNSADRQWAQQFVEDVRAGRPRKLPTAKQLRALVRLFALLEDPELRDIVAQEVLRNPNRSWQMLWLLWQGHEPRREPISQRLAIALLLLHRRRPELTARRLPRWLPLGDRDKLLAVLMKPGPAFQEHCERENVPLTAMHRELRCSITEGPGCQAAEYTIRRGPEAWWSLTSLTESLSWADEQATPLLIATLDRALTTFGHGAENPSQLRGRAWGEELCAQVFKRLGDPPEDGGGSWAGISERARTIYEWLQLLEEFGKILALFQQQAEKARATFWTRYLPYFRDARFYQATDCAVCLMRIDNLLIVEFGKTGNAAYVYRVPRDTGVRLRRLRLENRFRISADFKWKYRQEDMGGIPAAYVAAWSHHSGWASKFSRKLHELVPQVPDVYGGVQRWWRAK